MLKAESSFDSQSRKQFLILQSRKQFLILKAGSSLMLKEESSFNS